MSIAVAVKNGSRIIIASDSKRTFGSGEVPDSNLTDVKVRQIGPAYLAITGWGLYSNIFDDYLRGKRNPRLTDQAGIFAFFRVFWKELHERYSFVNDQRPDDESPFGDLDASFLIVNRGGIFSVACDMSVTQFEQYYAIGSGAPYALGALHALYSEKADPDAMARKAVESAIALDLYCGGAINVFEVSTGRSGGSTRRRARKRKRR